MDLFHQAVALFQQNNGDDSWDPIENSAWIEIDV